MILFKGLNWRGRSTGSVGIPPRFIMSKILEINRLGGISAQNPWFVGFTDKILISKNLLLRRAALSSYIQRCPKTRQPYLSTSRACDFGAKYASFIVHAFDILSQPKSTGRCYEGNQIFPK
jgi:hypothetical protein